MEAHRIIPLCCSEQHSGGYRSEYLLQNKTMHYSGAQNDTHLSMRLCCLAHFLIKVGLRTIQCSLLFICEPVFGCSAEDTRGTICITA